jgi:hypothetical protein
MSNSYPEPSELVLSLIDQRKKIEAIKEYRRQTGLGLREAKDMIDRIEGGAYVPPSAGKSRDAQPDRYDQLERIGKLRAEGILSEAEFEREKHRILGY